MHAPLNFRFRPKKMLLPASLLTGRLAVSLYIACIPVPLHCIAQHREKQERQRRSRDGFSQYGTHHDLFYSVPAGRMQQTVARRDQRARHSDVLCIRSDAGGSGRCSREPTLAISPAKEQKTGELWRHHPASHSLPKDNLLHSVCVRLWRMPVQGCAQAQHRLCAGWGPGQRLSSSILLCRKLLKLMTRPLSRMPSKNNFYF